MDKTKEIKKRILKSLQDKGMDFKDILRENAINLAKHHRKSCNGDCYVQLNLLRELLKGKYKIELTEEEEGIFI